MTLRPIQSEDRDGMLRLLTDPIIGKTFMLPQYPDPQGTMLLFQRMLALSHDSNRYVRAICLKDQLIGFINDTEIHGISIELGYVIDPAFHGKGYMTRALKIAIEELFTQGYAVITAGAFTENAASLRVMEKCGMQRLARTDTIEYRGKAHTCVYYHIQKQE